MNQKPKFAAVFAMAMLALAAVSLPAQAPAPFTIEDYFKVVSLRVEDWTRDGRWVAASLSRAEDRIPADNTRSGDPTYVLVQPADLIVLDTESGAQVRVFPGKETYRSPAWSPDGKKLALFLFRDGVFRLAIWNREARKMEKIAVALSKPIASNSPLVWTEDGARLLFSVRAAGWKEKSAATFAAAATDSVRVFDTDKPFLPWDEVSRRGQLQIPTIADLASGKVVEILPETPLHSSRLTADSHSFVFERDVTEKTDYDVIRGTKSRLEVVPASGGAPRVILKPADTPRSLTWAKTNDRFAYTEKGDVFIMHLSDKEPRRLTGEKDPAEKPAAGADKPEPKKKQTFGVSRFSPDGKLLLCTSARPRPEESKEKPAAKPAGVPPRQYWLINAETGVREMIYEFP
ncbi:MAG: PD40 domain-containing protein, partial [Candidatus Aminicenantes bacterium]|nr:PD40 domain-containing protein [Candidatus Aminicenantes bacterium]